MGFTLQRQDPQTTLSWAGITQDYPGLQQKCSLHLAPHDALTSHPMIALWVPLISPEKPSEKVEQVKGTSPLMSVRWDTEQGPVSTHW